MLLLFQPGSFVFDDDLVSNSHQSLETLVHLLPGGLMSSCGWDKV